MRRLSWAGSLSLACLLFVCGPRCGAAEWKEVKSGTDATLRSVWFADKAGVCAVGDKGTILASADGGKTWQSRKSPSEATLRGIHFSDKANGWIVGEGDSSAPPARGHILLGPNVRMGCGSLLVTTDGGQNWTRGPWVQTSFELRAIWMVSPKVGQICNHGGGGHPDGDTIVTKDGLRWSQRRVYRGLNACCWVDEKTGWAVGSRVTVGFIPTPTEATYTHKATRIVATTDGGATWTPQDSPDTGELRGVWFTDKDHGLAVGDKGAVQLTTDGGKTWANVPSNTQANLRSVTFADAKTGWIVGDKGTILQTADGGKEWKQAASSAQSDLNGVHANEGGKVVVAVGAGGTVLRLE